MNTQTKTQTVHSNHNYKVLLRMKPLSEEDRDMIEINDNTITVKDTTNKNSNDHQSFNFNTILKENHTQKDLFKIIAENAVTKIIEGHNACVISYGQTHSGKSYTIFGEDERYTVDRDTSGLKGNNIR